MARENYRDLTPIENVITFDTSGRGPLWERVQVVSAVDPDTNYPPTRVHVHVGKVATFCLTIQESRELRSRLEEAEGLAIAACRSLEKAGG